MELNNERTTACALWLYDMDIEDLAERQKTKIYFSKICKASAFLGVIPSKLKDRIGGVTKKVYIYQKNTNHKYAIRKVKSEDEIPVS